MSVAVPSALGIVPLESLHSRSLYMHKLFWYRNRTNLSSFLPPVPGRQLPTGTEPSEHMHQPQRGYRVPVWVTINSHRAILNANELWMLSSPIDFNVIYKTHKWAFHPCLEETPLSVPPATDSLSSNPVAVPGEGRSVN